MSRSYRLSSNRWFKYSEVWYGWPCRLERRVEGEIGRIKQCVTDELSYDATTLIRCNFCHVLSVAWSHYYAKPVTHRRSVMSDLIAKNVKNCQHHHWFFSLHTKKKSTCVCFINYDNYDVKRFKRVINDTLYMGILFSR